MIELLTVAEYIGVATGLLCVYLTTKESIWSWPTGLVSTILFVFVFFEAKLYSDMLENAVYIAMQLHGWWFWLYGRKRLGHERVVHTERLTRKSWLVTFGVIMIGSATLGYGMASYTDADFAYLDAFTTVVSLTAQWLLNRKILENWFLWIAVDIIGIGLYAAKGLHAVAALYAVFLVLATKGYFDWRRRQVATGRRTRSEVAV